MNIFILDKNLRVCHTLNSEGDGNNSSPFYDDEYVQHLETGAETFTFKTFQNEYISIGNYVAFMYNNECKLFQISEIEDEHGESFETKVYCEVAGLELTYEILRPREIPSANIKQYLENVLSDTDWKVGYVDDNIQWVHTINIENYSTIYAHIQETILKYECEIAFRVEKNGTRITRKYIDVYKQRGTKSKFRFDYDYNMFNVNRVENSNELATALIGVGKDGLNFKTAEWKKSEGDPIDKPLGQDFIEDLDAFNKWNTNGKHLMGKHECDSESPEELLKLTYKALQERKNPKMEYSMDVSLLTDDEVFIGDEVYVIDNYFTPSLWLSARINELTISFTDKTKNKCTFSNYKKIKSKIKNDLSGVLSQIDNAMFMGISKGGFLNSNLEVNGFNIQIKNKLINDKGKTYSFNIKNKKASDFLVNKSLSETSIMQSFAIDFINNHVYVTQLKGNAIEGNICLNKLDFNGNILGKMYLNGFGHGTQIGVENTDNKTYIWTECDGVVNDTSNYGSKICRFEFVDSTTYASHVGNVYNLVPEGSNLSVSINQDINKLSVRYKYNNETYVNIYDLKSVVSNTPRLINKVCIPFNVERSSHQGHNISENAIYLFEGKSKVDSDTNDTRITAIDFKGSVISDESVNHVINLDFREAEGIFFRQVSHSQFELYFGFASGEVGVRKCNIYKYSDSVGNDYSYRGSFMHNNGHTCSINECDIVTRYDGSQRRRSYLLYVNELSRFVDYNNFKYFIVAEFKNGKWLHNGVEFEPDINDSVVAELQETANGTNLTLYTYDYEAVRGQDGVDGLPGQDALFLELTNEYHSIPTDANGNNGIYSGCETSLKLYRGDIQLTNNVAYSVKSSENVIGNLVNNKYTVTNLTGDTGYVDLVANYLGNEYVKRFSLSKNKQGLSGEDGLTPTVYWLMTSASTISKDSRGNLKPSSITFWAKSQTGENNVVNYQGIFKIYESIDGNVFTLKHTSELDDTVPYTPSSTAQSIKCELYLSDGITLIDQDIVNIVKDGTDGFSGADAKYVLLTGEQLFKYTNNFTGTPTPSSITLTGTPFNMSSNNAKWYYKKPSDTNYTLISSNNNKMEFVLNHNDSILFANNNKVVTVKFDIDGYYDEMTIAKVSDGSSGSDGEDGYFVLLTNENHTVPCENNGDVVAGELDKAKTEIHVFKGAKEVDFTLSKVDTGCTSTYNAANKTISITSLTSKSATVILNIRVNNVDFTKVMSISKAIKGDTGAGVNIIGSLNSESDLPNFGNMGDAYIIGGFLYVWSGNTNTWENVGQIKGDQGIAGKPGADGITYYTWVKYADDENGNGISDDPIDSRGLYKKYMGMAYNKETQQESNNPKDYVWIKVVGENGHDSIVANLTNDTHTVPTDSNGNNGNYSGCSTQIELFVGSEKITSGVTYSFSPISGITGSGNTSNGTYTVTNMTIDVGYVDLTARYNNKNFVKRFTISKNKQGQTGASGTNGVSVANVDVEYAQNTSSTTAPTSGWSTTAPTWVNGKYIWSRTKTTLSTGGTSYTNPVCITGQQGNNGANGVGISSIVEQYYLSTSQTALSGGSWSTTVPTWQQGKYIWTRSVITYTDNTTTTTNGICVSGSKGDKGETGTNGINGTSPVLVTISGQQSMKYLDKTSAPTPSTITLTANVMEGNVAVSSGITYVWQYKNSGGTWVNLSGTYTNKTYSLAYDNSGFINEVAQVRVAVSYKNQTYYLEHTVTKIYDNKYISKQEVFDKITEGGTNQLIYKDPDTGEIYINATFIKSGQLLADIIKGGILTLGGSIGTDDIPVNGYMRVLGADNRELAVLNGGDMTINGLSSDEATIDSLFVQDIKSPKIPPAVTENTTIYVNQATGNDDVEFDNGVVYKTVQGAIDATPKNLNGFDVYIRLQGTSSGGIHTYSENLTYKGFYGGTLYTYLQKNSVHGYIVMRDCSARLSLVGGANYDEIPDGLSSTERANVKPANLYATGNTYYTICAINCTDVYIRSLDLWGSIATNSNGYPNYAVGVREGSNVFVRNVKIHSSTNGFHAQVMGRLFAINTYGRVTTYAYRCTYGGWINIGSGTSVSGATNVSTGDGCQVLQGNVSWDGTSSTGTNDNTTVNSNTTTYNATSGDSWKVKYSSWRKDNTVRQGDWSGTGMHKGCWFFGSQFNDIKGKTIKSIKLTIQRQSSGGNSGAVAFTLKMHNHTGRPSGAPSYLSGWSKNVSLSLGQSSTITITDSAVLTAIKNGTMKGFGVEVSSTSNSYYGILSPKLKAVVTYS